MGGKDGIRTQKVVFWWRWWDEAEHKSTPEKRLAFYDALMRYIFRGEKPDDPMEMDNPSGADWSAYDATHYFDVIDSLVEHEPRRGRGAQPGNRNAKKGRSEGGRENESETNKKRIGQKESKRIGNEYENESKRIKKRISNEYGNESDHSFAQTGENGAENAENVQATKRIGTNETNPLRMKNEEYIKKNEEEREKERENTLSRTLISESKENESDAGRPTLADVLRVAGDGAHRSGGETIPEDFAREWFGLMETSGWRDTRGNPVPANGWRGKFAFAWRDEKRRREREGGKADAADDGTKAALEKSMKREADELRRKGLM